MPSAEMRPRIEFYYGIGSRYSYLAVARLRALALEHDADIEWLPINSVRLLEERGYSPFEHAAILRGQYSPDYRSRDAERWAELYGIPFREPRGRLAIDAELLALAATAGKRLVEGCQVTLRLFAAVFHGQVRRLDAAECAEQAAAAGIDRRAFERTLKDPATAAALEGTMRRAHVAGVFGVPTFIVSGEPFWGNDRLPLLARYLVKVRAD